MSRNRVEPAYIEKKQAEDDLITHAETLLDSFEWVATAGRSSKADGSRLYTLFGIQLVMASIMVYLPTYFYGASLQELIFIEGEVDSFARHLVRTSIILGGGWAVFVLTMFLMATIPFLLKMGTRRDKMMPVRSMNFLNGIHEVSPYISLVCGSLVASICAKYYYPQTLAFHEVVDQFLKLKNAAPATAAVGNVEGKPAEDLANTLAKEAVDSIEKLFHYRWIFPLTVHMTFIALFVLLLEKIVVQIIAISYRSGSTAGRFTSNIVALKLVKLLFKAKADPALVQADRSLGKVFDEDVAKMVFNAMIPEESGKFLTVENLKEVLTEEQATILFKLLDIAQNGDLTRQEFIEAVRAVFDESHALKNLLHDHDNIISKVDSMLLFGVYSADMAFALSYLGVSFTNLAVGIGLLLLGVVAFFDDSVKKLVKSLVFVLITHPYDAGDRIVLDDQVYVIESVGLWTTTMQAPGALKTVVVNAALFDKKISNFRRSPSENEVMEFLCRPETVTEESLASLKEDCLAFLREKRREFQAQLVVESVDYIDAERMKICLKIFHRQNFQDDDARAERSAMFLLHAKDAFLRHGFVFSPPLQKVLVAQL